MSGEQKEDSSENKQQDRFRTVAVTSINMSFGNMVRFMVKWAVASIPAFIVLLLIGVIFTLIFGAIFGISLDLGMWSFEMTNFQ